MSAKRKLRRSVARAFKRSDAAQVLDALLGVKIHDFGVRTGRFHSQQVIDDPWCERDQPEPQRRRYK